ncbi:MAG TPA: homoserine dehydrogenase [Candidatus Dormibacteraeota bacterium]|nr:homoserine dehydrogenase [Candidatus Dormibacteraeota bacterium]
MPDRTYNLALVGFGNVGKELVRLLVAKTAELHNEYGITWKLTGVASRRVGWVADRHGLDPAALLSHDWPGPSPGRAPGKVREWLAAARADVLFEATSLDRRTGQPATEHLRAALESGAHAISANKGPIVHAYRELRDLARSTGRQFLFESTVMDGTPIFSLFPHALPAVELRGFRGLLNSTSNVVLTEMEKGLSLDEAVKKAQEIGVAETDPSDDLDGWDPAVKVAALVIVLMGVPIDLDQIERVGIRTVTPGQIRAARAEGKRYKLICRAERTSSDHSHTVRASVKPEQLPMSDPWALLEGTTSALRLDMDVFGLSIIEHKPGVIATAYGLFADFIRAVKG